MTGISASKTAPGNLFAENVVLSVLAVGGYSLDRAFTKLEAMREKQLTDPSAVRYLDEREVFVRLIAIGYNRGPVVTLMMARRLISVHSALLDGRLRSVADLIGQNRVKEAEALAVQVPGIGPKVFQRIVLLQRGTTT